MGEDIKTETEKVVIDNSVIELIKKAIKDSKNVGTISEAMIKKQIAEHVDFLKLIDAIDISSKEFRVILTFGTDELVYDDGEFYLVDAIDIGKRKKLSKKQARDMYIEYFIRYQLNPILENKKVKEMVKELSKEKHEKAKKDIEIKEKTKSKEKAQEKDQKESQEIVAEKKLQDDNKSKLEAENKKENKSKKSQER